MQDWKINGWKAANGKDIAYLDEWKWIYQWVTENPKQLKIGHVKAHNKGTGKEVIWNSRVDTIAQQHSIAIVTRSQAKSTPTDAPKPMGAAINHQTPGKVERQELINVAHQFMHEEVKGTLHRLRQVAEWKKHGS